MDGWMDGWMDGVLKCSCSIVGEGTGGYCCRRVVQMISLVNYEDCVSFTEGESRWYFRCSLEVTAV
jgi:hypothetical protein